MKHIGTFVCADINECRKDELHDCDEKPNEECHNTVGSFECRCREGYKRNINGTCIRKFLFERISLQMRNC